ncbi:RNA-directed DNA polymerase [Candidatus Saccharibacteria bacterium]|nr:RNA-directed DNA polymerase [Candidatus Saccharibacteria bacterium]
MAITQILTEQGNWEKVMERLRLFQGQGAVVCASVAPGTCGKQNLVASSIMKWWHGMERESIKMALYFNYMVETDILECYSSMDARIVGRALDGPNVDGFGHRISELLMCSERGQPIGMPQGSALGDFLAEIVLGYIDVALAREVTAERVKGKFIVLRFRDDYRIFTKDEATARKITRCLAQVLERFGMKLNPQKTKMHDDIISMARKQDKRYWEFWRNKLELGESGWKEPSLQKRLLVIYDMAREFPNSGAVRRALVELYKDRIVKLEHRPRDVYQMLSIVANLMAFNPRSYVVCVAIMTKLISFNPGMSRNELADAVLEKAKVMPNVEYLEVWLQRLTMRTKPGKKYGCKLCKLMYDQTVKLWNSQWLDREMRKMIVDPDVVNHKIAKKMPFAASVEEVSVFAEYDDWGMGEFGEFGGGW